MPLIAVLFFGQLLLPLFLPVEIEINRVLRAVTAFALFAAAYVAEDVRGGWQAILTPRRKPHRPWASVRGKPNAWWCCLRPCASLCRP